MSGGLVSAGRHRSWSALGRDPGGYREALVRGGVETGELVASQLSSERFAELFCAAGELGIALQPSNARLASDELRYQLQHSGARWLVSDAEPATAVARELGLGVIGGVDQEPEPVCRPRLPAVRAPAGATLLYTSGTTGRPKGALVTRRAFEWGARAAAAFLGADGSDRWLACMPLFHVGGIAILVRCQLAGSTAIVQGGFDPEHVSRTLEDERVTHVSFVATMLERLLDARGDAPAPASLRLVLLGGGPIPKALLERARALGYPVAPTYGLTEAASQVATRAPGDRTPGVAPLPGVSLEIRDDDGKPVAVGHPGEIWVRGGNLMDGYWRDPEATRRALVAGWLRTGDVGQLCDAGRLSVLDRRSDLIVSGGENVYPAEIEALLVEHPGVDEACVAGRPDARFGARPHAWYTGTADPDDLRDFCAQRMARYKQPVEFTRVAELPRGPSGKPLRRMLSSDAEQAVRR